MEHSRKDYGSNEKQTAQNPIGRKFHGVLNFSLRTKNLVIKLASKSIQSSVLAKFFLLLSF
jgi:hypothetical protein